MLEYEEAKKGRSHEAQPTQDTERKGRENRKPLKRNEGKSISLIIDTPSPTLRHSNPRNIKRNICTNDLKHVNIYFYLFSTKPQTKQAAKWTGIQTQARVYLSTSLFICTYIFIRDNTDSVVESCSDTLVRQLTTAKGF